MKILGIQLSAEIFSCNFCEQLWTEEKRVLLLQASSSLDSIGFQDQLLAKGKGVAWII